MAENEKVDGDETARDVRPRGGRSFRDAVNAMIRDAVERPKASADAATYTREPPHPACECSACERERALTGAMNGDAAKPVNDYTAPTFRDMAALEHAAKPITSDDITAAVKRASTVRDAIKRGELRAYQVKPALLDDADFGSVTNFLNAAQAVLTIQLARKDFDKNEALRRIAALSDFQRFFLTPAMLAVDEVNDNANSIKAMFDRLFS